MSLIESTVLAVYFAVLMVLGLYGFHRYVMIYLYYRHRGRRTRTARAPERWPVVTVQLPVFNEMYVVERLIDAVAALDYPRELLEIQVLDDSTDETREIAESRTEFHRVKGLDIHHIHRQARTGFKAGALDNGLTVARGELVAIFDADFVPHADFLRRTVPYFEEPEVGLVQTRWGHINRDYSVLTRVQAILLDAHFILEHGARSRSGRFFNFNGTAGIWRRRAIVDAGGWQHDTVTEDLDLSYRAQLRGWRFVFLPEVVSPAELPAEMNAFKNQQHRWAKGSIQTAMKLLSRILASSVPIRVKVEAIAHLTANLAHPLMVVLSVLMLPSMVIRCSSGLYDLFWVDLVLFLSATVSMTSFYVVSMRESGGNWNRRLKFIPFMMALGIGLSLNNARGVLEGLFRRDSRFVRTPKHRIESTSDSWKTKKYRGKCGMLPWMELGFGLYFTAAVAHSAQNGNFGTLPFLLLFQVGFLYVGFLSLFQDLAAVRAALHTRPRLTFRAVFQGEFLTRVGRHG